MESLDAELAGEIRRAVDALRGDAVRLLQDLVQAQSVTGEEGAVQEVVERTFRARGFVVDRWEASPQEISPYTEHVGEQDTYSGRPNLVGVRAAGQGGGRSILLNAHVDTTRWRAGILRLGAATRSQLTLRGISSTAGACTT